MKTARSDPSTLSAITPPAAPPLPAPSRRSPRFRPPRRLRVTREGWIFIMVTLGVGAAAINTGNNLLFLVLGLQLSLIVVSGVMSEATLRHLAVKRHLPHRVHAQTPSLVEVTLSNSKRRIPSYSVELEDQVEGWATDKRCYFLKVAPAGKQTASYRTVLPRRGLLRFQGYRVSTRFPFGLFEKWREISIPADLVVLPRLVPVPPASDSAQRREGELPRKRPGLGDEMHGLRSLRPGDDYRSIHWRTSARRGRLMVREWEEQESRYLRLYLDNTRTASSSDDQQDPIVEQVISIATSLVLTRLAAGQGIHLAVRGKVGPSVAPGTSPDRLLRFLALLDYAPRDATPAFPQLPHGEAILVTAEAQNFDGAIIAALPPGQSPRGA